jgi:hypothetical protein
VRGSFDDTSMNERGPFLRASVAICSAVAIAAALVHARVFRDHARWAADQAIVVLIAVGLAVAHVVAFGWSLGFPVPHRMVVFFPFLAATFGVVHGGFGIVAALRCAGLAARARSARGLASPRLTAP